MPLVLGAAENAALFRLNLVQQQVWCKIFAPPPPRFEGNVANACYSWQLSFTLPELTVCISTSLRLL